MMLPYLKNLYYGLYVVTVCMSQPGRAQQAKYFARDSTPIFYTDAELKLKLPAYLKPVIDYPIRDVSICTGPDSTYYMTGTTGDPDMWAVTGDIKIWRSKDLLNWLPVITKPRKRATVWNVDRDGSWEKKIMLRDGAPFRPLWAPEIQYFNHTFWLAYCIPNLGTGILKSISGMAEGPYQKVLVKDEAFNKDIDPALFKDDDGQLYFVSGEGTITLLQEDIKAAAGKPFLVKPANAKHTGFEGAFLFKRNKKYYMACAEFVNDDYHCFVSSADHINGPYSKRYLVIPHGGHNTFFKDIQGNWWATFFGNDKNSPFRDRSAIIKVEFDNEGVITIAQDQIPANQ
jgi:beta-xylosidase